MRLRWVCSVAVFFLALVGCGPESNKPVVQPETGPGVELVGPTGSVRRDEIDRYEIRVRDVASLGKRQLVFRLNETVILSTAFEPEARITTGRMPAVIVTGMRVGDVVEWGLVAPYEMTDESDDDPKPVLSRFTRAPDYVVAGPGVDPAVVPEPPIALHSAGALRDLAARLDVPLRSHTLPLPHELGGGPTADGALLFPRGRVLGSRLRWKRIHLPYPDATPILTFRQGQRVLYAGELPYEESDAISYLPQEVLDAARPGAPITWSVRTSAGQPALSATFEVVEDAQTQRALTELAADPRLARQDHWVRRALEAELLLARGYPSDALQHSMLTLRAEAGPRGFQPLTERPTFFRLLWFMDPPSMWEPFRNDAALAARVALAALGQSQLLQTVIAADVFKDCVYLDPAEAAARVEAFAALRGGTWTLAPGEDAWGTWRALLGPGHHGPPWRAALLDELLVRGGQPLAAFLDVERHARARRLPPLSTLQVHTGPARTQLAAARLHAACGRPQAALEALDAAPRMPDGLLSYRLHHERGTLLLGSGRQQEALVSLKHAARVAAAIRFHASAQDALGGAEIAARAIGDYAAIADVIERRAEVDVLAGDPEPAVKRRADLGTLAYERGEFGDAELLLRWARKELASNGRVWDAARVSLNLGALLVDLGAWPEALQLLLEAAAVLNPKSPADGAPPDEEQRQPPPRGVRNAVELAVGIAYTRLCAFPQAEARFEAANRYALEEDDLLGAAHVAASRANLHAARGEFETARERYEEAARSFMDKESHRLAARVQAALGDLLLREDRFEDARRVSADAEQSAAAAGDAETAVMAMANKGEALLGLGRTAEGQAALQAALGRARQTGSIPLIVEQEARLARAHLGQGQAREALDRIKAGAAQLDQMVQGLGIALGPAARERAALLVRVGIDAAATLDDPQALLGMLERGRAQALADGLLGRSAIRTARVSQAVRGQAREAERILRQMQDALSSAEAAGEPARIGMLQAAVEKAAREREAVARRIEEAESLDEASLRPTERTIADIQGMLEPTEALVLFGLTDATAVALVIEKQATRVARLGSPGAIERAARELITRGKRSGARGGFQIRSEEAEKETDPSFPAQELRELVIAPLRLGGDVRQVLVSPTGILGYTPFCMLLPDHTVSCVPSAATLDALLQTSNERGQSVLAFGDPDYAGGVGGKTFQERTGMPAFAPLPGTRKEVEAVGHVTFLGPLAHRGNLENFLRPDHRWRALHLACHGLVNAERPMRCALALSPIGEDNGLLTVLDVLRLKIPADLVTLSACETGRGRIYRTEGVVGLTQAFMLAGAPRVICSQWKVDDDATCELMKKFYELWSPPAARGGLPAPEALKQAQAHVRAQSKWSHPYFWAPWVLWGNPR